MLNELQEKEKLIINEIILNITQLQPSRRMINPYRIETVNHTFYFDGDNQKHLTSAELVKVNMAPTLELEKGKRWMFLNRIIALGICPKLKARASLSGWGWGGHGCS